MSLNEFLFAALPGGLLVAGLLALPIRAASVPTPVRRPPATTRQAFSQIALGWGLGILVVALAVSTVVPGLVAGWNSSLVRRVLLEGAGVAVGVWFLIGLLSHLYRFAVDEDRPRVTPADAAVVVGVFWLAVGGVLLALTYRWTSSWGSRVAAEWVRGMLSGSARPELIGDLPLLARIHALTLAAVIAIFPYSRWVGWVRRPAEAVHRAWADAARPPSPRPAGVWLRWGPATARAVLIVGYLVIFTVIVPSMVVERLGGMSDGLRDLITVAVWGFFLIAGVAGLRLLQRKARV